MTACQYAADGDDQEFMQCLFQGLAEVIAIAIALEDNAAQQAQGMPQVQID